jgi:hypothetical protein
VSLADAVAQRGYVDKETLERVSEQNVSAQNDQLSLGERGKAMLSDLLGLLLYALIYVFIGLVGLVIFLHHTVFFPVYILFLIFFIFEKYEEGERLGRRLEIWLRGEN